MPLHISWCCEWFVTHWFCHCIFVCIVWACVSLNALGVLHIYAWSNILLVWSAASNGDGACVFGPQLLGVTNVIMICALLSRHPRTFLLHEKTAFAVFVEYWRILPLLFNKLAVEQLLTGVLSESLKTSSKRFLAHFAITMSLKHIAGSDKGKLLPWGPKEPIGGGYVVAGLSWWHRRFS